MSSSDGDLEPEVEEIHSSPPGDDYYNEEEIRARKRKRALAILEEVERLPSPLHPEGEESELEKFRKKWPGKDPETFNEHEHISRMIRGESYSTGDEGSSSNDEEDTEPKNRGDSSPPSRSDREISATLNSPYVSLDLRLNAAQNRNSTEGEEDTPTKEEEEAIREAVFPLPSTEPPAPLSLRASGAVTFPPSGLPRC